MPLTEAPVVGKDCKLYLNAATHATPTWTEVKSAIILGFEANGKSVVTGKDFTAHDERYYMPLADGRIAVLTVVGPANHYDREGVRDIALTFQMK